MNERANDLLRLIKDYQIVVEHLVDTFQKKYGPVDWTGWRKGVYPKKGDIKELGIAEYNFHGKGLYAVIDGKEVDVDFAGARYDGFDAIRLWQFMQNQPTLYPGIHSENDVREGLAQLLLHRIISKLPDTLHSSLFFLTSDPERHN